MTKFMQVSKERSGDYAFSRLMQLYWETGDNFSVTGWGVLINVFFLVKRNKMSLVSGIFLNFRVIKVIFKRYQGIISAHKNVKSVKIWNEIKPLLVKKILILFFRRKILFE